MFLSSYHPEIFRGYYHWQRWYPCTRLRSKVKVTEVMTPFSRFRTVTPVWIHMLWWNDAQSLMLLRRGALLFFKVIHQISRSCRLINRPFESNLSKITRPVAAIKSLRFALDFFTCELLIGLCSVFEINSRSVVPGDKKLGWTSKIWPWAS